MSNIVFSFDANAAGMLAALDAIEGGLDSLISMTENVASSFANLNATAETLGAAWTTLFSNFNALSGAMDDSSSSFSGASKSAADYAYQLQQLNERAQDLAANHADAVEQIKQQEQDLTETTQEEIQKRTESYDESMLKLVQSHADAIQQINDQEASLSENYFDTINNRLIKLGDPVATRHQEVVDEIEQQIDAMLASGNKTGLASLEQRLNQENQAYNQYITNTIEPYFQDLDQTAAQHYQNQLTKLQQKLAKENTSYDEQKAYLTKTYQEEEATLEKHYKEEEAKLEAHLAKENQQYAQQMQRLAEERAHLMSTGGGGGGGAGAVVPGTPALAGYIELFKQLGINPEMDPAAASQAMQDWILGLAFNYKGKSYTFGQGQAFGSQLTIPQIEQMVGQFIAHGQDPTRALAGNENFIQIMSDLIGFSGAATSRSPASLINSWMQVIDKASSGNTQGLLRQFSNLGISKQLLEKFGVKFGGTTGNTILNPADVMNAIFQMGHGTAGGLGAQLATHTFSGIMNQFKDVWNRTALEIGDPNNPNGLWKQLVGQLSNLLSFVMSHREDFVNFGKTIFEWVISKFKDFNEFLRSAQFKAILGDIAHAFREIGDALHWLGQHKDILHLLLGLLGVQVGGKLLGGIGGGILGLGGRFLSGGPLGMVGGLAAGAVRPGAGGAASPLMGLLGPLLGGIGPGMAGRFGAGQNWMGDFMSIFGSVRRNHGIDFAAGNYGGIGFPAGPVNALEDLAGGTRTGWAGRLGAILASPREGLGMLIQGGRDATQANLGRAGMGMMNGVMSAGGAVSGAVSGAAGTIGSIFSAGGGGMGGVMALMDSAMGGMGTMAAGLLPALGGIAAAAGPILLVAAAIAGLVAVLVMNRQKIMPFINTVGHFLGQQLQAAAKAVMGFVHQVESRLGPAFGPGSLIYKGIMFFASLWMAIWPGIQRVFEGVWNVIAGVVKIAWSIISGIVLIGLDILGGKWGQAWTDMWNMVKGVFEGIWQVIKGVLQIIQGAINGAISFIFQVIVSGLMAAWHFIIFIGTSYVNFWKGVITAIIGFFTSLPTNVMNIMSGLGTALENFFTKTIPSALQALWKAILNAIKWVIDQLINTVVPGALQGPVHSALGFAEGGRYPGKELSIVGERGPELFFSSEPGVVVSNQQIRAALLGADKATRGGKNPAQMIFTGDICIVANDPKDLYNKLNVRAGRKFEHGRRGSEI